MIPSDRFYLGLRSRRSESELGGGGFLVAVVVAAVVRVVFRFCRVGWFVAAGRVRLDDEGFAASCVLEECDAPIVSFPFAPAYGLRVGVADVVCRP